MRRITPITLKLPVQYDINSQVPKTKGIYKNAPDQTEVLFFYNI